MRRRARIMMMAGLTLAAAGCTSLKVADPHGSVGSRMWGVAGRFDQDFRTGGMAQVSSDIDACYRQATIPVTKMYALQDCLVLDYTGYTTDVNLGRKVLKGPPLPYFENTTFAARTAPLRPDRRVPHAAAGSEVPRGCRAADPDGPGSAQRGADHRSRISGAADRQVTAASVPGNRPTRLKRSLYVGDGTPNSRASHSSGSGGLTLIRCVSECAGLTR